LYDNLFVAMIFRTGSFITTTTTAEAIAKRKGGSEIAVGKSVQSTRRSLALIVIF
jgi:hypothetical protein